MRSGLVCNRAILGLTFITLLLVSLFTSSSIQAIQAKAIPGAIGDQEFWRMVTDLSEVSGVFPQQYMSNEDSLQFVIPNLKAAHRGGVYIGVGSEQNFTYIAAIQPKLAFIVDIRRDNMLQHLVYKSLFEISPDRADFVSHLFSRKRPSKLNANASATALFDAFQTVESESSLYEENLRVVMDNLVNKHKFPLSDTDRAGVARIMNAVRTAGPYTLKGFGDTTNPTYAQLMSETDLTGRNQSYLASEENFRIVRELERKNLVIPLVGDFAGNKTIIGVGRYLKEHDTTVNVFYVSNVERYLFEQGDQAKRFYGNASSLPLAPSSTFIRSVTSDISKRLGIPIPDGPTKWRTFLFPMNDCLSGFASGKIQTYRDLF